jgi:type 1 glutamine amidotransferase
MKKAIIFGNYTNVSYHPLKGPDKELSAILQDFETEITEDYDRFTQTSLRSFDLCVSYTEDRLGDEQVTGLCSYVLNGGGLLAIHNGISVNARYEPLTSSEAGSDHTPTRRSSPNKPADTGISYLKV